MKTRNTGSGRLVCAHCKRAEGDDDGPGRSLLIIDGDEQRGIGAVLTGGKPLFTNLAELWSSNT